MVERIARNPMKRALRLDKVRLAALEATLKLYADPDRLAQRLPTIRTLARPAGDIRVQAERLLPAISKVLDGRAAVGIEAVRGQIGSGALPVESLPSFALALRGSGVDRLADAFRALPVPVIGRIRDGALLFDLRTLDDETVFAAQLSALVLPP
jgi:L-seryl-tRNA(Ser) seleniumtransferase